MTKWCVWWSYSPNRSLHQFEGNWETEGGVKDRHHDYLVSLLEVFHLYLFVPNLIANTFKLDPVS